MMIKTHLCETEKQMRSMKREKISYDINRPTKAQMRKSLCQRGATKQISIDTITLCQQGAKPHCRSMQIVMNLREYHDAR